jgi:hypothetical protein
LKHNFITDFIEVRGIRFPQVSWELNKRDKWNNFTVRLSVNRMKYIVEPGLYAVGNPDPDSIVLVSANFKLSFDSLRSQLQDLDAWILVLDTKGINVWCAAGKGTFGTDELVKQVRTVGLEQVVNHKILILPQLGAPGVAAHEVKKHTGFSVKYGPVRAEDISEYLDAGLKATPEMRQVHFYLKDRLLLVPIEMVQWSLKMVYVMVAFLILAGMNNGGFSLSQLQVVGTHSFLNLFLAFLGGVVFAPILLPWLPTRVFSIKGFFAGILALALAFVCRSIGSGLFELVSWFFIIPAISSFLAVNFTGASTYTSLSGVKKELKIALPLQIAFFSIGCVLWIIGRFI